jgi:hypothetical protein
VAQRFDADELSKLEPDTFVGLVRAACDVNAKPTENNADGGDRKQATCDHVLASKQAG